MARIKVIEDGEIVEKHIVSRSATVHPEDGGSGPFTPAVVQNIEYDHEGQMSSITTVCGETENRRESDEKPNITVSGIAVKEDLEPLKNLKKGDTIRVVSDLYEGKVTVKRVTITQNSSLVKFQPEGGEEQLAFEFQLQLRKP